MELNLSNVVDISVSAAPAGIGQFNVNNLLLLTSEVPTVPGVAYTIYKTSKSVSDDFGSGSQTAKMATAIFSQTPNLLAGGGYLVVAQILPAELLVASITRLESLVQFCGVITQVVVIDTDLLNASDYVQAKTQILFAYSADPLSLTATTGVFWKISNKKNSHTRCLIYMASDFAAAGLMGSAYAGRGLSTNFSGSNTTNTMHLKDLATIGEDSGMTQTLFALAQTAGADVYASFQGTAKVFASGANKYFDQVYNLAWFTSALSTAGFNALAQSSNKVAQTEDGVSTLQSAYRQVCEQALSNRYSAPGAWTSPDTFGNQQDFLRNIQERGYYIYSAPVAQQLAADRTARKAPLVQIAIKEAGAIHTSSVLVNINA